MLRMLRHEGRPLEQYIIPCTDCTGEADVEVMDGVSYSLLDRN